MVAPADNFRDLRTLCRRSASSGIPYAGPFSPTRSVANAVAHNLCWLLDNDDAGGLFVDLALLDWAAKSLNAQCDTQIIRDNPDLQVAISCVASRLFFSPEQLNGGARPPDALPFFMR